LLAGVGNQHLVLQHSAVQPGHINLYATIQEDPADQAGRNRWWIEQGPTPTENIWFDYYTLQHSPDEEFLNRVCQEAFGRAPSDLERHYYQSDTDAKRREKLIDLVLKDPAVAKRVGSGWREKMLAHPFSSMNGRRLFWSRYRPVHSNSRILLWSLLATTEPVQPRLEALLSQLLDGQRADGAVLDALTAATLGRLPTETERKFILASIGQASDKAAAWREVLATLAGTAEAMKHADGK
jgi:hypothetical protein